MLLTVKKIVKTLPFALRKRLPRQIEVVEISGLKSRSLNKKYRKKNKPANVLSFYYGPDYGEILLCPNVIRREAKKQGNTYKYQFTWMILHGTIHLTGLHHEGSKATHEKFERVEKSILGKF